jgi:hypothetical protein
VGIISRKRPVEFMYLNSPGIYYQSVDEAFFRVNIRLI